MELRNAVRATFGVEVPATLAFDYPTTDALAAYLGSLLAQRVVAPTTQGPQNILALAERRSTSSAVEVIAAAAKYPGAEHTGKKELSACDSHWLVFLVSHFKCSSQCPLYVQRGTC